MRTVESRKKAAKDRVFWNIENSLCVARFSELLLDGVSAEKMALLLGADFFRAPSAPQIRSLFRDRYFCILLGNHIGQEKAEAALRIRCARPTTGLRRFTFDLSEGEELPPPSKWTIGDRSSRAS